MSKNKRKNNNNTPSANALKESIQGETVAADAEIPESETVKAEVKQEAASGKGGKKPPMDPKKRKILLIVLICALAVIIGLSVGLGIYFSNKGDDDKTDYEKLAAADRLAEAIVKLGGENWSLNLTEAEVAALPDEGAYYILKNSAKKLSNRFYLDIQYTAARIERYASVLEKKEVLEYARDPMNTQMGIDLLGILSESSEFTADDFADVCYILLQMSFLDAKDAMQLAYDDILKAVGRYQEFSAYATLKSDLDNVLSHLEATTVEMKNGVYNQIVRDILAVDAGSTAAEIPNRSANKDDVTLLKTEIERIVNEKIGEERGNSSYAEITAAADAANKLIEKMQAAIADIENDTIVSTGDDYEELAAIGGELKTLISSTIEIGSGEDILWAKVLVSQGKAYVSKLEAGMPFHKFSGLIGQAKSLKATIDEYTVIVDDEEFKGSSEVLLSNRDALTKLLKFSYDMGFEVNKTIQDNINLGEDIENISDMSNSDIVALFSSLGQSAADMSAAFGTDDMKDVTQALRVCIDPLSYMLQNENIILGLNLIIFSDSSKGFLSYSDILKLASENFEVFPLVLNIAEALLKNAFIDFPGDAYEEGETQGLKYFTMNILREAMLKEGGGGVENEAVFTGLARLILCVIDANASTGKTGLPEVTKVSVTDTLDAYFAQIDSLGEEAQNEMNTKYIEFWYYASQGLNLLENEKWAFSKTATDALDKAFKAKQAYTKHMATDGRDTLEMRGYLKTIKEQNKIWYAAIKNKDTAGSIYKIVDSIYDASTIQQLREIATCFASYSSLMQAKTDNSAEWQEYLGLLESIGWHTEKEAEG